jgi:hypothetical protein
MMPRKLTEEGIARIRAVEVIRKAIPTRRQLAAELGVSKSLVDHAATSCNPVVRSRETTTKLQQALVELGLAKP